MPSWRSKLGPRPVAFILGNEGGDCDSVVCAFAFSQIMAAAKQHINRIASSNGAAPATGPGQWMLPYLEHTPVPICNFPAADLALRKDVILAFRNSQQSHVFGQTLLFSDQVPLLSDAASVKDLQKDDCVFLVDHNIPTETQMHLAPFVRGIVDHHALPSQPLKLPSAALEEIETIGSAASILTRLYRTLQLPLDPFMSRLLLAPVLLDTANFKPEAKKAVEGDFLARDFLCKIISAYSFGPAFTADDSCKQYFKQLQEAREDYEGLTAQQCLSKDAKLFHFDTKNKAVPNGKLVISISSWGENLDQQVLKKFKMEELTAELVKYGENKGAHATVAMFHKKGERHIVWHAATPFAREAAAEMFWRNKTHVQFEVEPIGEGAEGGDPTFGRVKFVDASVSRKMLSPKIQDYCKMWDG